MEKFKETPLEGMDMEALLLYADDMHAFTHAMEVEDYTGVKRCRLWGELQEWYQRQPKRRKSITNDVVLSHELSKQLEGLYDAKERDKVIEMPGEEPSPFPLLENQRLTKIYIREDYVGMFEVILEQFDIGNTRIPISGTLGIGKSVFFIYIVFRIIHKQDEETWRSPQHIVYQDMGIFYLFNLERKTIGYLPKNSAFTLVNDGDVWYIISGMFSRPLPSLCPTIFLASPQSKYLSEYSKMRYEFYFPVWTEDEIWECRDLCYENWPDELVREEFMRYGGVPLHIFFSKLPDPLKCALGDTNARQSLQGAAYPTQIFRNSHKLMHCVVEDATTSDGVKLRYQFKNMCIASEYVGRQLWIHHYDKMVTKLQKLLCGRPDVIGRQLFEIYGHLHFESGVENLRYRCLEDDKDSGLFSSDALEPCELRISELINAIEEKHYYKPHGTNLEAIDSLSQYGMFQFTVSKFHDIEDVQTLCKLEKLYEADVVHLYFVVPSERTFDNMQKQDFKVGSNPAKLIPKKIRQYVLLLPIGLGKFHI